MGNHYVGLCVELIFLMYESELCQIVTSCSVRLDMLRHYDSVDVKCILSPNVQYKQGSLSAPC